MSAVGHELFRERLYAAYATTHAGEVDIPATRLAFRNDLLPLMPESRQARVLDIGCGQGALVEAVLAAGYNNVRGVDVSPEQVHIAHRRGLFANVVQEDFRRLLAGAPAGFDVVLATDVLEHLTRPEVLEVVDLVHAALRPGGCLIARVPNAGSPFAGLIRYGDLTHESWFTARSLRQLASATGFQELDVRPCAPSPHGLRSTARSLVWRAASGAMKVALAAETGVVRGHVVTQNLTFRMAGWTAVPVGGATR